jgi:CheY-like chemotaxis protein
VTVFAEAPPASDTTGAAILIVDDNPSKRVALRAAIKPLGHEIVEADSGFAALRTLMNQDFAVILLDVRMPIMDGFETAALVRQRQRSELTPILFITAFRDGELGPEDHYVKGVGEVLYAPVDPVELRRKIATLAEPFNRTRPDPPFTRIQ